MGITGLIPFLEKSSKHGNINQFSGCTVAIDAYCWLHRGAFSCAEKIVMGQATDGYVLFCLKYIRMLLANKIKPILVFDGGYLPAKAETEKKRRESRSTNKARAVQLIKMGQTNEGRNLLKRCVDISHEMAVELIKKCQEMNIDCIVAPYEADAELAYLNTSGIADVVITEDSDLILFGCKKIFFKMDLNGNGLLVEQDRLHLSMKVRQENFDMDKFRHMCILSGCDYLPSLPGIGLNKALKFVLKNNDPDIHKALVRLGSYLNLKQTLSISVEYRDAFICALVTFKHQLVYCPIKRKQVRLNPPSPEITLEQLHFAGDERPEDLAFQLALGNVDPFSHKKLHNYNPDINNNNNSWSKNNISKHVSIWSKNFKITNNVNKTLPKSDNDNSHSWPDTKNKMAILDTVKLSNKISPQKRSYDENDQEDYDGLSENQVFNLYTNSNKKRKIEVMECTEENDMKEEKNDKIEENICVSPKNINNPFTKQTALDKSPCLVFGRGLRKRRTLIAFEPTQIDENTIVESKFFNTPDEKTEEKKYNIQVEEEEDLNVAGAIEKLENLNNNDEGDEGDEGDEDNVKDNGDISYKFDEIVDDDDGVQKIVLNSNRLIDSDYSASTSQLDKVNTSFFNNSNKNILIKKKIKSSKTVNKRSSISPKQNLLNMYGFKKTTVSKK